MEALPSYINIVFILTTLLAVWLFYKATLQSIRTLILLTGWLILQAAVSLTGFYAVTRSFPPRFMLAVAPALLVIILLFATGNGRKFIDSLDLKALTLFHIIRIPVELVLFWLFLNKTVPQLMTFEGHNFDILSGLTAPVMYYFGFINKKLNHSSLLVWNFLCLILLVNIMAIAILSAPFTFQRWAFNQPNIAVFYFPFIWLPCCIVPLVLFSHLAAIRQLLFTAKKINDGNDLNSGKS